MTQEMPGLLSACENFFESWFGPALGAPEHLERIEARRQKSKEEFCELLFRFVRAWNRRADLAAVPEGWKLVPIEPTDKMFGPGLSNSELLARKTIYKNAVAAAPLPTEKE